MVLFRGVNLKSYLPLSVDAARVILRAIAVTFTTVILTYPGVTGGDSRILLFHFRNSILLFFLFATGALPSIVIFCHNIAHQSQPISLSSLYKLSNFSCRIFALSSHKPVTNVRRMALTFRNCTTMVCVFSRQFRRLSSTVGSSKR